MSAKKKNDTRSKTVEIKDEVSGTTVTITVFGKWEKLSGQALVRVGCNTCCDEEKAYISKKDAHKLGRLLLSVKNPTTMEERKV